MKRLFTLLITFAMMLSHTAFATDDITVLLDGVKIEFDVKPQIINDRTMVPMRKIFETLGASVEWDSEAKRVYATTDELYIVMEIGQVVFSVTNTKTHEKKSVTLDSPPIIIDSRTLAPARAISEGMGYSVDWADETRTVLISRGLNSSSDNTLEDVGVIEWQ